MAATLQELTFGGELLQRGFWLYVWEISPPVGKRLYYVGRTGDSSSTNAQSPFNRMGQHLGFAENSNMLRRHLRNHRITPERCKFRLVALGPVLRESKATTRHQHDKRRDVVAGMEKALAELMMGAGYQVMNTVSCRMPLDGKRFSDVKGAFARAFPLLPVD
ncbi:MAG: hypothetical protein ABI604_16430 [Nitrospirota bacterium]